MAEVLFEYVRNGMQIQALQKLRYVLKKMEEE